jgi:hypothetical protein
MKRLAMLAAVALAACGTTDESSLDSTLMIENNSSYTLIEINLSPTASVSWGSDLLGSNVLEPGDAFRVSQLECDTYDIRVVDEDHDECILDSVDLCLNNAVWSIDDADLALCAF